jgi:hypothetical protein
MAAMIMARQLRMIANTNQARPVCFNDQVMLISAEPNNKTRLILENLQLHSRGGSSEEIFLRRTP